MRESMKSWLVLGCTLLAPWAAVGQEVVVREVLGGKVSFEVPASFEPLSEELLRAKYPSANRPAVAYSNPETTVNVAVGVTPVALSAEEIPGALEDFEGGFLSAVPNAVVNASEVGSRGGHPYFFLDVWTPAVDTDVRNLMFGTVLNGQFVMISFNCTREMEAEWLPHGRRVMDSIEFRD